MELPDAARARQRAVGDACGPAEVPAGDPQAAPPVELPLAQLRLRAAHRHGLRAQRQRPRRPVFIKIFGGMRG